MLIFFHNLTDDCNGQQQQQEHYVINCVVVVAFKALEDDHFLIVQLTINEDDT